MTRKASTTVRYEMRTTIDRPMGTFRGEVTDYQPPARIGFRQTLRWFGTDLMEARPEYSLEADGDKTIVHHIAEGELFGGDATDEARCGAACQKRASPDRRVPETVVGVRHRPVMFCAFRRHLAEPE